VVIGTVRAKGINDGGLITEMLRKFEINGDYTPGYDKNSNPPSEQFGTNIAENECPLATSGSKKSKTRNKGNRSRK
jgi:hypothetical protein